MKKQIVDLIYQSFERELNQKETDMLNLAFQSDMDYLKLKEEINELRRSTRELSDLKFSGDFENSVMDQIQKLRPYKKTEIILFNSLSQSFRRIAIAAAFLIFSLVMINWLSSGDISIQNQANETIEDEIESSLADLF